MLIKLIFHFHFFYAGTVLKFSNISNTWCNTFFQKNGGNFLNILIVGKNAINENVRK